MEISAPALYNAQSDNVGTQASGRTTTSIAKTLDTASWTMPIT